MKTKPGRQTVRRVFPGVWESRCRRHHDAYTRTEFVNYVRTFEAAREALDQHNRRHHGTTTEGAQPC